MHRDRLAGVLALARMEDQDSGNTGSPAGGSHKPTDTPQGADWADRVADGPVLLKTRGNARRGKGTLIQGQYAKEERQWLLMKI